MEWVDLTVTGIHETYHTSCPYDLCKTLEIGVRKVNYNNPILLGNDSTYIRGYLGGEIIFIRDDLDYLPEKFILAHELGHAILHVDIKSAHCNKNLLNIGKLEKQATYFAFKFLDIAIDPVEYEGFTIEQIARSLYIPVKYKEALI